MRALYTLSILLYRAAIGIAAWFVPKARLWVNGRRNWQQQLAAKLAGSDEPVIWMHCASLGEFEQGRPILEALRREKPGHRLLLTFFSPSGFEVRKNYTGADIICYLPADTPANARKFAELVKPQAAIFIKYEFWLNHLNELRARQVPHILVAGIFRPSQAFFKPWGGIFREALQGYTHVFVQDEQSEKLLRGIGITHLSRGGDPRFDRVADIAAQSRSIPVAEAFAANASVFVAGSTWPADEQLLIPALAPYLLSKWKLLIAPHELGETHLQQIEKLLAQEKLPPASIIRFSAATPQTATSATVLIVDNIGMLSALYGFGQAAYIGGGFGKSIHNTLEAAVWNVPVIFGPRHQKFNEALGLLSCGGGFAVNDENSLKQILAEILSDTGFSSQAGKKAGHYVQQHKGATQLALSQLQKMV
ncbi:MAG: 3-deoxy-D-manno-octulosonic acid transferase [Bacteroidetes bacterium]|nr:3-deoxy-D-manno-octulosonic acid transferase [Bacteroidota bacterium]